MKSIENKKVVLEELRRAFDKNYATGDVLDAKLQSLLSYSSIIVSFPLIVIDSTLLDKLGIIFWELMLLVLIMYVINLVNVEIGLKPREYSAPVSQNLETIKKLYYSVTEERAIEQAIVDNIHFSKRILDLNKPKLKSVTIASILLGVMVTIILIAIPVGLYYSSPTLLDVFKCMHGACVSSI